MKYLFVSILSIALLSCSGKSNKEKEIKKEVVKEETSYNLLNANNSIKFTAYKTTDKIPVEGRFKEVEVIKNGEGKTIKEAINGAEFKIPVSSIETNDAGRNVKIKQFFFGIMTKTVDLTGKINIVDDTTGFVNFVMNGVTEKLPFTYTIEDNMFSMKATMDINKWNAQSAIAKLNEICETLHMGKDGVSKTWNEVSIKIVSTF